MFRSARRLLLRSLVIAALAVSGAAWAQSGKTFKIIVGFPAGGGTDAIARTLADRLKDELSAPVVVENKGGAGGQLAAQALKASPPDGTTFFISHDHTITILPLVMKNPGFDPARDFVPVAGFASFVNAFALSPGTPAKSLNEYVAWVKAQGQGKSVVGVPAPASTPEFLVKVLGGARQATLPDVPTLSELGIAGFEDVPYYGFFAPAGTPKAAMDQFSQALSKVVVIAEVRDRLTALGLTVEFMSSQQLANRERAYAKAWTEIIRKSGFQPQ